jgi:NitT/TauT family transport system permease protein
MGRNKGRLGKALAAALALLAWQAGAMLLNQPLLLVTPARVLARLSALAGQAAFWETVLFSFIRIVSGFVLAAAAGSLLAAAAARSRAVETLLWPWVAAVRSVPVASFIILSLIWLSSGRLPVFISFSWCFR